jgi:S1-C subfamily serine protease
VKPVFSATPEKIFQDAINYTVKVRTIVEMPFSEDEEAGAYSGTGFVVDVNKGWILTNAHVAGYSPSRVEVAFRESGFFPVEKLYVDPYLDVAVLRASAGSFPPETVSAPLECKENPPVGHPVGAFGHPWSLPYTGTRGIISGSTFFGGTAWLQTDAPINAGNSGGPLISMQTGRLVGVNTASVAEENMESMNFAVPMKYVCRILTLLREDKDPSPPVLPARFMEHDYRQELVVAEVYHDESDTSLHAGDAVVGVEGAEVVIQHETQLVHLLRGRQGRINLRIVRDGEYHSVPIDVHPEKNITQRTGIYVSGLVIACSSYLNERGLDLATMPMVHSVKAGTVGQSEGVEAWDFIKTVDGKNFVTIQLIIEKSA